MTIDRTIDKSLDGSFPAHAGGYHICQEGSDPLPLYLSLHACVSRLLEGSEVQAVKGSSPA